MSRMLRKRLRANSTLAERAMWRILWPLRTNGFHFRKQVEIGPYYVDFACLHVGLVVEVDGETHFHALAEANDRTRDEYLTTRGFKEEDAVKVGNLIADVLDNPHDEATIERVKLEVKKLTDKYPVYEA